VSRRSARAAEAVDPRFNPIGEYYNRYGQHPHDPELSGKDAWTAVEPPPDHAPGWRFFLPTDARESDFQLGALGFGRTPTGTWERPEATRF
jgi:hypothetical protein